MSAETPTLLAHTEARRTSAMADALVGSEILAIAAEIRARRAAGAQVCNLTVGDFDPVSFRIPELLERKVEAALRRGETNYPPSDGLPALRESIAAFYEEQLGLRVAPSSVLVCGGARPAIYGAYRTVVDPGDRVVYPVPSWNNNHYCHIAGAVGVPVSCGPETAFLPTPELLERHLRGARLLALCSPLNPAGTAFDADTLARICDLVLDENARRAATGERPLYVMYDQVYWMLTFGDVRHVDPVRLRPEMERYTIYVDGISKALAATGLRVGWVVGPPDIIPRMSSFLGHVGAWAPRAEQAATAEFLYEREALAAFRDEMIAGVRARLDALHAGMTSLASAELPVRSIPPMGAIYLSVRFALHGARTASGATLRTNEDIRRWLLESAALAVVPFQAFGVAEDSGWFRLSVGATTVAEIEAMLPRLRAAIASLVGGG